MESTKALAILNQHVGKSLVFASREDVENVAPQFEPVVTVVTLSTDDFTDVGMGNMYPGKSATNRIADAAGVSFLPNVGGTREDGDFQAVKIVKQSTFYQACGEFKVIGAAQGQRLKPDGTPRFSSVREYEFNVIDRANEDFLKDASKQDQKYTSEIAARKHLIDLKKFATQRASTGAQLAVIRELAGIPTTFKRDQITKPMVFSQIIENNRFKLDIAKEIMKTPDGRQAVAAAIFGTSRALFGPQAAAPVQVQAPPAETVREAEGSDTAVPPDDDDLPDAVAPAAPDPRTEKAVTALAEWAMSDAIPDNLGAAIQRIIDQGETDPDILEPVLELVKIVGEKKVGPKFAEVIIQALINPSLDKIILGDLLPKARARAEAVAETLKGRTGAPA